MNNYIRLPLKNAYNVRDLGGYACIDGKSTKWRSFLRADNLANLDAGEIQFLIDYGVTYVIDLRSKDELRLQPSPFSRLSAVDYINIPLMTDVTSNATRKLYNDIYDFLRHFYIGLIKNASLIIKVIFERMEKHILKNNEACILFHGSAGKDRTGIIAMLLLGLAGVEIPDIISNYESSETYIKQNPAFSKSISQFPDGVLTSKNEYIESVINYIVTKHKGIPQYLQRIGLSDETLEIIRSKIYDNGQN